MAGQLARQPAQAAVASRRRARQARQAHPAGPEHAVRPALSAVLFGPRVLYKGCCPSFIIFVYCLLFIVYCFLLFALCLLCLLFLLLAPFFLAFHLVLLKEFEE